MAVAAALPSSVVRLTWMGRPLGLSVSSSLEVAGSSAAGAGSASRRSSGGGHPSASAAGPGGAGVALGLAGVVGVGGRGAAVALATLGEVASSGLRPVWTQAVTSSAVVNTMVVVRDLR